MAIVELIDDVAMLVAICVEKKKLLSFETFSLF